jgi:hypothetical protein
MRALRNRRPRRLDDVSKAHPTETVLMTTRIRVPSFLLFA